MRHERRNRWPATVLTLCILLVSGPAWAQTGIIQGRVTDATTNESIPGANVYLEQLPRLGTATAIDGTYEVGPVPTGDFTLVATFIGYKRYSTPVTVTEGVTDVNIALEEDLVGLDEIVVTGQGGGIERKRLSTSIDVITPKQLEATPYSRLDALLQAQLPGAQVRFSSGQAGTASLIRSRGPISAFGSTTPVIYVDGVRVDNLNTAPALSIDTGGAQSSALPDIPIEDIERVEFIKGGAATTLYGSDAASGVIQIFTKQGLPGVTTFAFDTEVGWSEGTTDFLRFDETADILYRPGLTQQYRLTGSGGAQRITYSFSASMQDDNGFRRGYDQTQYGLRTTVGAEVTPITRYTGSFGFSSNRYTRDPNANNGLSPFGNLEGGTFGDLSEMDDGDLEEIETFNRTLVDLFDFEGNTKRFQTSQQLAITPLDALSITTRMGLDYRVNVEQEIESPAYLTFQGLPGTSSDIDRAERRFLGLTLEGTARHEARVGDFSFVSTAGGQVFRDEDRQAFLGADNIAEGSSSVNNAADQTATDFDLVVANYGVYVQENVGFRDRYFIEGGLRVDANSAFGEEIGTVAYPKAGMAYAVSEEPFFAPLRQSGILPSLKLRANYGFAGKFPTPFTNDRLVLASPFLDEISFTFGQFGNDDLKPERVRTIEVGGDVGLFNDNATLEVTYYNARTEDALFTLPFIPSSGRPTQLFNVGEIENKGWEISSNLYLINGPDVDVRLNASLNTLDNTVLDNGGAPEFSIGGFTFLGQFVDEGEPVGYLRGDRVQLNDDNTVALDDAGNPLIERDAELGSPLPDAFGTLGLSATIKNRVRLFVTADYQWGAQGIAVDDVLRFLGGIQDEDRFPQADDGSTPVLETPGLNFFDLASFWVEDTDFLKVRLISISYTLPERWYRNPLINRIEVGVRAVNPFNFATSSFDPEVTGDNGANGNGAQNSTNLGVFGFGTESPPRRFLFDLKVNF